MYLGREPLSGEVIIMNSIESQFNGVLTTFNLTRDYGGSTVAFYPVSTEQLLVSLGGVIQKPDTTGNIGFKINSNQIIFAVAPPTGTSCFIVSYGNILDIGTPANNTVTTGKIVDGSVTPIKLSTGGPWWLTNGNVGIGTTNPSYKLDVYGGATQISPGLKSATESSLILSTTEAVNRMELVFSHASTNYYRIQSIHQGVAYTALCLQNDGGNVGIGTTNPSAALSIQTTNADTIKVQSATATTLNFRNDVVGGILDVNNNSSAVQCRLDARPNFASWILGNVGIGTTNPTYNLQVVGSFGATTKSFIIDHPTKEGKKLQYGSLESPYHGIRLTGRNKIVNGECVVTLPDYMSVFVKEEDVNIQLTNIKHGKILWVEEINILNNTFTIKTEETTGEYEFFWDFTSVRTDVDDLEVEF